jgi:hypothetical protein
MHGETDHFDQADEDSLTYTVSDEALEATARMARDAATYWFLSSFHFVCC